MSDKPRAKGIVEDRGCTDILCCLIFIASIIIFIIVAAIGFSDGKPEALTAVWDSSGIPCGIKITNSDGDVFDNTEYKYLFFSTLNNDYITKKSVCVKECPTSDKANGATSDLQCRVNNEVSQCSTVKCDYTQIFISKTYAEQDDILCQYATTKLLGKICMIGDSAALSSAANGASAQLVTTLKSYTNNESFQEWLDGVDHGKFVILGGFFIAFIVGLIYLVIVRYFAGLIVWLSILVFIALEFILGIYCLNRATEYQNEGNEQNYQYMKILAYVVFAIGAFTIVVILCMYTKIRLGIAIIKCAALYVADVKLAMLIPIVTSIIAFAWIIIWIIVFVYRVATYDTIQKDSSYPISSISYNQEQKVALWFTLFMGLWINAFFQAFEQFLLVGSVCIWYFERKAGDLHSPLSRPFWWGIKKHLGSLAFGSFILAVVQLIRIILAYIEAQSKKTLGNNKLAQCLLKCLQCYMACFERFIKFLNRNAYIQIALKGTNFCVSAKNAMSLIWNNMGRASIVQGIGSMFIFIGEGFICLITTFICYVILTTGESFKEYSPWLTLAIIFVLSFTIGILFMTIYGLAVDAIFVCFCQDEDDNKGGNPEHTPDLLQEFLATNAKQEEEAKK